MTDPGKYERIYQDDANAWDPDWDPEAATADPGDERADVYVDWEE